MFESLLDCIVGHKTLFLYLFIIMMVVLLVYIYVKKYFVLTSESETIQLKEQFEQLRADIGKLKTQNQQLNSKLNDVNTKTKYGQISNHQLPFSRECMENTPFYTIIGSQFLNNIDDDLTPTNRQADNFSLNNNRHLIEEMSEQDNPTDFENVGNIGNVDNVDNVDNVVNDNDHVSELTSYKKTNIEHDKTINQDKKSNSKDDDESDIIVNNEQLSTVSQTTINSFVSKDLVLDKIINPNISKMTTSVLNSDSLVKNKKRLSLIKKNSSI